MNRLVMTIALTAALLTAGSDSASSQTHVFGGSSSRLSRVQPGQEDTSQEYIGKKAAEFVGLNWLNSKPITLASLKGKTVLLSFWHGDCCSCNADIDGLRYLQKTYGPKGLAVIAIHDSGHTSDEIKKLIKEWEVTFPVALDGDWNTTKKYQFVNTSYYNPGYFLIDGNGIITRVSQPFRLELPKRLGGECNNKEFDRLELDIKDALAPKTAKRF